MLKIIDSQKQIFLLNFVQNKKKLSHFKTESTLNIDLISNGNLH